MSRTSSSKIRSRQVKPFWRDCLQVSGLMAGGLLAIVGVVFLAIWAFHASGISGPNPETIKAVIAENYDIQGIGWNGDGRDNGVGVQNVGTHAYGISVDGTVHICLANLDQAQSKQPIVCNDKFVVEPKP